MTLLWRLPSLFDPPWVNDEGTYFAVAQSLARGYRLYASVWENKPPALYLLYEAVYHRFGPSLFAVRILACLAALATVLLIVAIARCYTTPSPSLAAGMLAGLLLGVPFLEGTTANAETFLVVCTALGVYLALRRHFLAAGLAMGLAVLIKVVAGFDAAALGLYLVMVALGRAGPASHGSMHPGGGCRGSWQTLASYVAGILAPLALAGVLAWRAGVLGAMVRDAVLYDLGYVGHANGGGLPWLALIKLVVLTVLTVWLIRRPFPVLWLVWATAGALISGRIFGHYALQVVPPLCIAGAMWAFPGEQSSRGRWTWLTPARSLVALPLLFLALAAVAAVAGASMVALGHDSILARRLQWYPNFVRMAVGAESYATYCAQVDDHVTRNLAVVADLRRAPPGKLLVWGNIPWVYVLSGRSPATPYTSAIRDPEVPGETVDLRRAIRTRTAAAVVVVEPPLPPLGSGAASLRRRYSPLARVSDARLYAGRARPARTPGQGAAPGRSS